MKLMQTMAGGAVGGAEEFFVRLAIAFHERGIAQTVVARPNSNRIPRLVAAGIDGAIRNSQNNVFGWVQKHDF